MSFATIAAPEAVRCPASAQLLLPIARSANVVVFVAAMAATGTAQIDLLQRRHRHGRGDLAIDRRLPLGRDGVDEVGQRTRQRVVDEPALTVETRVRVVELQVHREHDEQRIARGPWLRLPAQHQVLERPYGQAPETGVDARGIGVEHLAVLRWQRREHLVGDRRETMPAMIAIRVERDVAKELGEAAAREAAREVHLEVAILCVREPQREGRIGTRGREYRRYAERVALDRDVVAQPRYDDALVEIRKTAAHAEIRGGERARHQQGDAQQRHAQPAPAPRPWFQGATSRIFIVLVPPETPDSSPIVRISVSPGAAKRRVTSSREMARYKVAGSVSVSGISNGIG